MRTKNKKAPAVKDRKAWALAVLLKAGWGKVDVYRVYLPYDAQDDIECCFVTTTGLPKTAYLGPTGEVLEVAPNWGPPPTPTR